MTDLAKEPSPPGRGQGEGGPAGTTLTPALSRGEREKEVFAGVGFRRSCPADEIVALVRRACTEAGCTAAALAAPDFKRDQAARAAASLGLNLILIDPAALAAAQPDCVTHSAAALRTVGIASVAEASALAAAGPGARLLLTRITSAAATCALAQSP